MKPMLNMFQWANKFEYKFLASFQSFFWFIRFMFDKLAPPLNKLFTICFK